MFRGQVQVVVRTESVGLAAKILTLCFGVSPEGPSVWPGSPSVPLHRAESPGTLWTSCQDRLERSWEPAHAWHRRRLAGLAGLAGLPPRYQQVKPYPRNPSLDRLSSALV